MNEWMNEWMNKWTKERANEWTNEWTNERTSKGTKERANKRTNERRNEECIKARGKKERKETSKEGNKKWIIKLIEEGLKVRLNLTWYAALTEKISNWIKVVGLCITFYWCNDVLTQHVPNGHIPSRCFSCSGMTGLFPLKLFKSEACIVLSHNSNCIVLLFILSIYLRNNGHKTVVLTWNGNSWKIPSIKIGWEFTAELRKPRVSGCEIGIQIWRYITSDSV